MWPLPVICGLRRRDMSELRDKATRLLLKSAWEMADDNEDELSAVFDGQHGFTDDLRRRAIDTLEGVGCMPSTPPDHDEMERLIADSGLSLDVLDKRAREIYDCGYSTTYQRYQTAIVMLIDDLLGAD